ncbi:E3 ubiquitin-protein ligase Topors [Drosophila tropicalis]|uniref:E3 ubiquitin-protein ligase Topors n=1 Tax=Drosophila tropicalis TaxID=46794 RepID=UPI0035AC20F4
MSSRYKIYWRVYIYANSLYSLPSRSTCDYREWTPLVYRRGSFELHRIMVWVYRDLSVLLRNSKRKMKYAYDTIFELLPLYSMKDEEFSRSLSVYLDDKTNHFIHELINFARSPYDDVISYECNVQYCTLIKFSPKMAGIDEISETLGDLHSFVEFSRRINDDDCSGFEADLEEPDDDNDEWVIHQTRMLAAAAAAAAASAAAASQQVPQITPQVMVPQTPPTYTDNLEYEMFIEQARLQQASRANDELNGVYMPNLSLAGVATNGAGVGVGAGAGAAPVADVMSAPPIPPSRTITVRRPQMGRRGNRRDRPTGTFNWPMG